MPMSAPAKKKRNALWRLPNSETSSALAMRHAPAIDAIDTRRFLPATSMCPSKPELFTAIKGLPLHLRLNAKGARRFGLATISHGFGRRGREWNTRVAYLPQCRRCYPRLP